MKSFKGCPKCGGSIFPERQLGGVVDFCCLQCGRRLTTDEVRAGALKLRAAQAQAVGQRVAAA